MVIHEQSGHLIYGEVVAINVTLEDYMAHFAEDHCEWVEGVVIKVSPSHYKHMKLIYFLYQLLDTYFALRPIGEVIGQPFVLRLPAFPNRRREPDLMAVLKSNPNELTETLMDGPADIVIEVVLEESAERDHGEKFIEYEKGGVPEYWIIDPLHEESRFYRLDEQGRYRRYLEGENGNYHTPTLPDFKLHVPTLWQKELPKPTEIISFVQKMLQDAEQT